VLLAPPPGFLERRCIDDMQCFGRAYFDASRSRSAIDAQIAFMRFGFDAVRNLDTREDLMRRMGHHLHGAEGASNDAALAADAARLIDLHGIAAMKNGGGRAGVEAGRILALMTGRHRRDLEGADQMQAWLEMGRREPSDIVRWLVRESASDFAGPTANALG
jgi:hypothetical protein